MREVSVHDIAVGDVVVVEAGDKVGDFGDVCVYGWVGVYGCICMVEGGYVYTSTPPHVHISETKQPNPTQVAADGVLLEYYDVTANESSLTGP